MWKYIVLAGVVGFLTFVNGAPEDVSNRLYEDRILALLEDIRLRMCYSESGGLPQLEPLVLDDQLDVNLGGDFGSVEGYIRNLKVDGLSGFIAEFVNFLITLKFRFIINVPKLVLSGDYSLKADLGGLLELEGADKFRLTVEGLRVSANGSLVYQGKMTLQNFKILVEMNEVNSEIQNLTGDEEVDEFINHVVNELLPKAFDEYIPPETVASLEHLVEDFVSDLLKDFTVSDILGLLGGSGSFLPPLNEELACKIPKKNNYSNDAHPPSAKLIV